MKARLWFGLMALLPILSACGQPTASQPEITPTTVATKSASGNEVPVIELPESESFREAAVTGDSGVTWTPVSNPAATRDEVATRQVQSAIEHEAGRLAKVDYATLSMPLYVTVTRSLKIAATDFTGGNALIESYGEVAGQRRWALYGWRGPDVPQLPDRLIVFRWVEVYALYDLNEQKVVRLLATVRGEVHE